MCRGSVPRHLFAVLRSSVYSFGGEYGARKVINISKMVWVRMLFLYSAAEGCCFCYDVIYPAFPKIVCATSPVIREQSVDWPIVVSRVSAQLRYIPVIIA